MAQANPYATPEAVLERGPDSGDSYDQTSPLSPKGRFGRITYMFWSIAFGLLVAMAMPVLIAALGGGVEGEEGIAAARHAGEVVGRVMMVITAPITIILAMRRLHDLNQSGWLSILMLIPLINGIMALILVFAPGNKGSNKYGPPPKPYTGFQAFVAFLIPVVAVAGIVAAIVIPAVNSAGAGAM